jgi:hypothetical protein
MTYNVKQTNTLYAVYLRSTESSLSSGDAVPYAIESSTSGHGVTVSSGVITLPSGDWLISLTCECTTNANFTADIYEDSIQNTTFPTIRGSSSSGESNLDSTAIPLRSDSTKTIELRVNNAVTVSANSDCLIYGFKI